jgi:hypothetical protein
MQTIDDLKLEEKFRYEDLMGALKWFLLSLSPFLIFLISYLVNINSDLQIKNESSKELTLIIQTDGENEKKYKLAPRQEMTVKNAFNTLKNNFLYMKNEKNEYILTLQIDKTLTDKIRNKSLFRKAPYFIVIPEEKYWYMKYN